MGRYSTVAHILCVLTLGLGKTLRGEDAESLTSGLTDLLRESGKDNVINMPTLLDTLR